MSPAILTRLEKTPNNMTGWLIGPLGEAGTSKKT